MYTVNGVGAPNSTTSDAPTIHEAISRFLDHTQHTQSIATATSHHQALTVFVKFLSTHTSLNPGSAFLSHISASVFYDFLIFLQTTYSPETEHSYFRAVTALANSPTNAQTLAPEIPFEIIARIHSYLEYIPLPEPDPEAPIQRERLRLLRDKALIFTIMDTGLKTSEITALRLENIDFNQPSITFQQMALPLEQTTIRAIQGYLRERAPVDQRQNELSHQSLALFARHDKRASSRILPISRWTVGNIITYWTHLAIEPSTTQTQPVTPSLLRHHFVIATLTATDDLQLTQQRARHKDKGTTRHYLHQHNQTTPK
jgi:integrase